MFYTVLFLFFLNAVFCGLLRLENKLYPFAYYFFLPFLSSILLLKLGIEFDTKETLNLLVPLIWGVFIGIGGSIVYLNKSIVTLSKSEDFKSSLNVSKFFVNLGVVSLLQCLVFICLALLYPIKDLVIQVAAQNQYLAAHITQARSFYDTLIYIHVVYAGLISVLVGSWSMFISYELSEET